MAALLDKKSPHKLSEAWEGDVLERKEVAKYLTPVIASTNKPFVISISSGFGTGKTFFIKNWHKQLNDEGYKAVYFNAWETDYADDALIAFISAIRKQLVSDDAAGEESTTSKLETLVKKGGSYLTRKTIPIILKGLARKAIGEEAIEELVDLPDAVDEELVALSGQIAEKCLESFEEVSDSINGFKDYLAEFVTELTQDEDEEGKKKLIIFVDELDRCRPTYAIELLECIKHLFNVERVVFVLAIDETQLSAAVASVYGTKLDGESYLRKFIDWQLKLPKPSGIPFAKSLFDSHELSELTKLNQPSDFFYNGKKGLIEGFGYFSQIYHLSLREQAQCFTDINLIIRSMPQNETLWSYLTGLVAVLRVKRPEKLKQCLSGESPINEFLNEMDKLINETEHKRIFNADWERYKQKIHAYFLNNEAAALLSSELEKLQTQQDPSSEGKPTRNDVNRRRYIEIVLGYYREIPTWDEPLSLAHIVNQRFEFASRLTQ